MADYRHIRPANEPEKSYRHGVGFWWKEKDGEAHEAVTSAARYLEEQQGHRSLENLFHARLYGNNDLLGFGLRDYSRNRSGPSVLSDGHRISMNLIAAVIDTLHAKITKNRPRPTFTTDGGNWKQQQRAKLLDKFVQGQFYETQIPRLSSLCALDAFVFGTGIKKHYIENGRLRAERVFPDELLVDDADGRYMAPRQLFQRKHIAREVLLELFGDDEEKRHAIQMAEPADTDTGPLRGFGDMVLVWESWHLPSNHEELRKKRDAETDGRHVIAIGTATLLDERWTKNFFPFSFYRPFPKLVGFWGMGLAERLAGRQREINRIIIEIHEILRKVSKPRILFQANSINPKHINSDIDTLIQYTGPTPPIMWSPNAIPPEMVQRLQQLWAEGFEEVGVSRLSASMQKPAGLNSGAAIRDYNDIESERFVKVGQAYEDFHVDDGRIQIELTRDAAEEGGDYEVMVPDGRALKRLKWSEVKLDEDAYVMKAFPVSSLPTTPSAKRQEIQEYIQAGWIDPVEGRRLMNLPDLEQSTNLATAACEHVDWCIERALENGEDVPVDAETMDLALLVKRATAALLDAEMRGAPDEGLEKLRLLRDNAAAALAPPPETTQAPPPMPGEATPSGPMAPGEAPPPMPMPDTALPQ